MCYDYLRSDTSCHDPTRLTYDQIWFDTIICDLVRYIWLDKNSLSKSCAFTTSCHRLDLKYLSFNEFHFEHSIGWSNLATSYINMPPKDRGRKGKGKAVVVAFSWDNRGRATYGRKGEQPWKRQEKENHHFFFRSWKGGNKVPVQNEIIYSKHLAGFKLWFSSSWSDSCAVFPGYPNRSRLWRTIVYHLNNIFNLIWFPF